MMDGSFEKQAAAGGELLFRLVRSLAVMESDETRCCGVTTAQSLALLAMKAGGGRTMGEVAEALGVSAGTATRVVDKLVRDGQVERAENPEDRRSVCVGATAAGRATISDLEECYGRFWRSIYAAVPPDKLTTTLEALELLVGAVEKTRETCTPAGPARDGAARERART